MPGSEYVSTFREQFSELNPPPVLEIGLQASLRRLLIVKGLNASRIKSLAVALGTSPLCSENVVATPWHGLAFKVANPRSWNLQQSV